jgi:hypothetical protein
MSTRCHIIVEDPQYNERTILYRHSDGYPDGQHGVLASLVPFVARFMKHRGFDACYMAAQIMADQITRSRAYMRDMYERRASEMQSGDMQDYYRKQAENVDNDFLGFGISNQIHSDVEFIYRVTPEGIKVETASGRKLVKANESKRMMTEGWIPPRFMRDDYEA